MKRLNLPCSSTEWHISHSPRTGTSQGCLPVRSKSKYSWTNNHFLQHWLSFSTSLRQYWLFVSLPNSQATKPVGISISMMDIPVSYLPLYLHIGSWTIGNTVKVQQLLGTCWNEKVVLPLSPKPGANSEVKLASLSFHIWDVATNLDLKENITNHSSKVVILIRDIYTFTWTSPSPVPVVITFIVPWVIGT